ncbi:MAG: hypothetical protein LQ338_005428 [Usnochroma carphineum]|nr:MAG: hypothetical protein LQ338_005428 [Usnochroma carphineum]
MSLPQPPVPLKGHCSVIYNNTLYTYQSAAFQSLPLEKGGTWSELPMGVSTEGSTCVLGNKNGDDSLFVVGGSTDGSQQDYSGMQRFSFKDQKWETCNPAVNVAKNRLQHGSTFLPQSSSILIYGGSQDGNAALPSSQTFLVSVAPPYNVQAFSSHAPPVVSPLVMPFNASHALMLGGNPENTELFTFGPTEGWQQLNASLKQGLPNANQVQATIMDGSDGSKLLELFNLHTSPNQISTLLLQQPTTKATSNQNTGTTTSPTSSSTTASSLTSRTSRKRKRVTLAERPAYNSTLAPQDTRDGYSLAQDPQSSLVVASGGNSQDVLCIFNQTGNQWVDAPQFFSAKQQQPPSAAPSKVQPPPSSPTGKPPPPTNPPGGAGDDTTHRSLTILGAVLGAIFGFAALCVLALLLLRCVRRRRERQNRQRRSVYPQDDKHDMDFIDRGEDHTRGAGGSFGHKHAHSGNSTASATAEPRAASAQSKRSVPHKASGSGGSGRSFFSRTRSPTHPPVISEPIMHPPPGERNFSSQPMASPEPRTEPRTDIGWSKYWAHNSKDNLGGNGVNRHESAASHPTAYTSGSRSDYSTSRSTDPHQSAEVEPLNIRTSQVPSNPHVVSPTSGMPLPGLALSHSNHGVVRPEPSSPSSMVSDMDEEDEYRLDHPSNNEGQESWTPVRTSEYGSTWTDPRVSSVYADSMIYPHPGERVRIPNFPGVPTSRRPSNNSSNVTERGMRSTAARDFGRGAPRAVDEQRQLAEVSIQRDVEQQEFDRMQRLEPYRLQADSAARGQPQPEARTFPRRPEEPGARGRGGMETEDMSWLNLGR